MDELVQQVSAKTGLPADQTKQVVETVIGFLKDKLPAPIAGQLDGFLGGGGASGITGAAGGMTDQATGAAGGLMDQAKGALGGMFGGGKSE